MNIIFKKLNKFFLYFLLPLFLFLLPILTLAQENNSPSAIMQKAKVIEIIAEEEKDIDGNSKINQQDLKLLILNGENKNREVNYFGISEIEVFNSLSYKVGDKVFLDSYFNEEGDEIFYVVDKVRSLPLIILGLIFFIVVFLVGRFKGLRALLALILSFLVIIKFILPKILTGADPFLISLFGGLAIMTIMIYLTEGFKRKSHLAILSVFISLTVILALSLIFVSLADLSGLAQEEAIFLTGIANIKINFQGLLLAGFIIGAIGVLDDIIIGQIEATESLRLANPELPAKKIFILAYRVGNTHLGAIINTLFLTYTGASLPLLLLFVLNKSVGLDLERFFSTELVSTEVLRTLVGSIGVMLSMPIATFFGAYYGKNKEKINKIDG